MWRWLAHGSACTRRMLALQSACTSVAALAAAAVLLRTPAAALLLKPAAARASMLPPLGSAVPSLLSPSQPLPPQQRSATIWWPRQAPASLAAAWSTLRKEGLSPSQISAPARACSSTAGRSAERAVLWALEQQPGRACSLSCMPDCVSRSSPWHEPYPLGPCSEAQCSAPCTSAAVTCSCRAGQQHVYAPALPPTQDATIREIERRLSEWSLIPVGHGEGLQVREPQSHTNK